MAFVYRSTFLAGDRGDREGDDPRAEDVQPSSGSPGREGTGCCRGVYQGEHPRSSRFMMYHHTIHILKQEMFYERKL